MKPIQFKNNSAQRVYLDYIQRCRKTLKGLPESDTEECLLEINSHIYEYKEANRTEDEMESLLNVLDRLGLPEDTLKEFVASKKINQAVRTLNPKFLIQALFLNISRGLIYVFLSLLFVLLFSFPILIICKLIYPEKVGCFVGENTFYFGFISRHQDTTEVLGNWFIPVAILIATILYFLIIFILKSTKHTK